MSLLLDEARPNVVLLAGSISPSFHSSGGGGVCGITCEDSGLTRPISDTIVRKNRLSLLITAVQYNLLPSTIIVLCDIGLLRSCHGAYRGRPPSPSMIDHYLFKICCRLFMLL